VTQQRTATPADLSSVNAEETGLSRQLGKLFALAEAYPELQADDNFRQLSSALVEIEEHIQFARRYYNGAVRDNNTLLESFPTLIIARAFGFRLASFFEIELSSQRRAPNVAL
jgi:LemA protein